MEKIMMALLVVPDNGDKEFLLTFRGCERDGFIHKLKFFTAKGYLVKSFVLSDGVLELDFTYNENV